MIPVRRSPARPSIAIRRLLLLVVSLMAAMGAQQAVAGPRPDLSQLACSAARDWSFAFDDADVKEVANAVLGDGLGLSFSLDPGVTGRMSFRVQGRMTPEALLSAFEATLSLNNIALVKRGNQYVLAPRGKARTGAGLAGGVRTDGPGYQIDVAVVKYATPSELVKAIANLSPPDIVVHVDDRLGFILLGGSSQEIDQVKQVIGIFDRSDLTGARIRYRELVAAPADVVAGELNRVLQGTASAGATIIPLKRLNALVVVARSPAMLADILGWIDRLDTTGREERNSLWLYKAQNVSAEALAKSLDTVVGAGGGLSLGDPGAPVDTAAPASAAPATATSPGDSDVRIGVDKDSNTLIIAAPASRWIQIQKILNQIDTPPDQVLIEATILEVTLSDEFRFGVDWSVIGANGRLTITSTIGSSGAVSGVFPGFSATYIGDDIRAAVTALSSKTNVEVVSSPKLVALNNRTSTLQVGDQVPVSSQSSRSAQSGDAPIVVNTEYRDTGVILKVTPRINGGDSVLIDISQEVSGVAKTSSSGIDSPTIQQRKIESGLIIRGGQTVALGGLISSNKTIGSTGLPWLKDLPLVGGLLRHSTNDNRRTELIILLTAKILRSPDQADAALADLKAAMKEMEARGVFDPK
jgi:general secretion pathway protein D